MALFSKRRSAEPAHPAPAGGRRVYSLGASPARVSAVEAFTQASVVAHAVAPDWRLFLVLSGQDFSADGRAGEWQFHYIYPQEHVEAVISVFTPPHSPVQGSAAIVESVTPWPEPGSVQESMLQSQGVAARLIVEEQWNDRVARLPGLPEHFVDSTHAMAAFNKIGVDLPQGGSGLKLKGRTPPGGAAVWELVTGFHVLHSPFA
jgi:hypothetical protein